ncbi:hypothetical protein G6F68_016018 [Rhizopus microsporus]|nr:hypothetical protein G6F68_016018 [Rhizopus microsporus]
MDATALLVNSLSTDRALREDATRQLELLAQENYPTYISSLCQILTNEGADDATRMSAGLAVKNSLTAKDFARKEEFSQRWVSMPVDLRNQVKQGVLQSLASPKKSVGNISGQVRGE